jgi:hypothetical protein
MDSRGVSMMITNNESIFILSDNRHISIEKYLRTQGVIDNQIENSVIELIRKFKGLQCGAYMRQPFFRRERQN